MLERVEIIFQRSRRLLLLILFAVLQAPSFAAEPSRIALVIGNADYVDGGKLKNPVNDAVLVTKTLKAQGFQVTTLKNATKRQMKTGIRKFTRSLNEQSVGLFYFAGHGIEFNGSNYLIPVDADILGEEDVEYESINAGRLLSGLELTNNGLNLVILDACRNNPYARSFRSSSRGLSRMQPASGSLIMYATEPGDVAADGAGNNGVFTTHLVDAINQGGISIEKVFKVTAQNVSRATAKKQAPYIEGVVLGEFYFSPAAKPESAPPPVKIAKTSRDASGEHERLFWNSVTADPSREMYEAYLEQYPNGNYAILAKVKTRQLIRVENTTATSKSIDNKIKTASISTATGAKLHPVIDVSGTYTADITYTNRSGAITLREIGRGYFGVNGDIEISITQTGNNIVGELSGDQTGDFKGTRDGDTITIKWHLVGVVYSDRWGVGEWKISEDGQLLQGTWKTLRAGSTAAGDWSLTRKNQ